MVNILLQILMILGIFILIAFVVLILGIILVFIIRTVVLLIYGLTGKFENIKNNFDDIFN